MPRPQPLVLVGAGGTASDVLSLIDALNLAEPNPRYEVLGLLDDAAGRGHQVQGHPVLGKLSDGPALQQETPSLRFVDCLGSPSSHTKRASILTLNGLAPDQFASLIHPAAVCASDVQMGPGCLVFANVTILSGVTLGGHVTILSNCVLNHGVTVEDFSILASNVCLSGEVQLGHSVYIGCGANVKERVSIGAGALVGLGSAVICDVGSGEIVAGVPAKALARQP